ncbi:hypothetical protein FRC07_002127 [Ceratobasidium sp. 392]|nr:hypothetical protein FRC07_002127 [Ceratobasidium sp. 392]
MAEYTHIINGKSVTSTQKLSVINPGTQEKIAEVPVATKEQLDEAVTAARAALPAWSATTHDERAVILNQVADVIQNHAEEYHKLITLEQGKPLSSSNFETELSINRLRGTSTLRLPNTVLVDNEQQKTVERYVPIGVISFTGSSFTGQKVMESSSAGLKRVTLELGGNDPLILLPDVDPKVVAPCPNLLGYVFKLRAGLYVYDRTSFIWYHLRLSLVARSLGIATKRLYVHEKIYDKFRDAFVEFAKTVKVGNGLEPDTQLGPIQNLPQYRKVVSYFDDAHANNYKFVLGGDVDHNPTKGLYVPISIVENPPEDSKLVRQEPFGPIVPFLKWSDEKDVVKRASEYPCYTDTEAVERIALQIQAGTVSMNQFIPLGATSSFGGHKQSGLGVEGEVAGLKAYSNIQIVTLKKDAILTAGAWQHAFNNLTIRTNLIGLEQYVLRRE